MSMFNVDMVETIIESRPRSKANQVLSANPGLCQNALARLGAE